MLCMVMKFSYYMLTLIVFFKVLNNAHLKITLVTRLNLVLLAQKMFISKQLVVSDINKMVIVFITMTKLSFNIYKQDYFCMLLRSSSELMVYKAIFLNKFNMIKVKLLQRKLIVDSPQLYFLRCVKSICQLLKISLQ